MSRILPSRTFACAAALALSFGGLAAAQTASPQANPQASPDAAPQAAGAADPAQGFSPGMAVKDPAGQTVGTINRVGQTADGTPAVELNVEGKAVPMALAALTLAPSGDYATTTITKAQIQAAARQAPG